MSQGYDRIKPFQQETIFRKQTLLQRNALCIKSIGLLISKGLRGFANARRNTRLPVHGECSVPFPGPQAVVSFINGAGGLLGGCRRTSPYLAPVDVKHNFP